MARRSSRAAVCAAMVLTVGCGESTSAGGPAPPASVETLPDAPPHGDAVQLAVGAHHACLRYRDGGVSCWGSDGRYGQMGDGGNVAHASPRRVPRLADVIAIASGARFTVALDRAGGVWCWGESTCGVAGSGPRSPVHLRPRRVPIPRAAAVFAEATTACARLESGETLCWGDLPIRGGTSGGPSRSELAHAPTRVPLTRLLSLGAAPGILCGVEQPVARSARGEATPFDTTGTDDAGTGLLRCWGSGRLGELLVPLRPEHAAFDGTVSLSSRARAVRADVGLVCAILVGSTTHEDDAVHCWGDGATTFGAPPGTAGPVVLPLPAPVEVALLNGLVCARDRSGGVKCVGRYGLRRSGRDTWTTVATPTPIPELDDASQLVGGADRLCVLRRDGAVRCAERSNPSRPPTSEWPRALRR